ncbi:MAG: N-acetyltransferase [Cyanobacteria bacterium J06634_5]
MMDAVIYRSATEQDIEAIAKLHALSWQLSYSGMLSDTYLENDVYPERLDVWTQRLAHSNQDQFVMVAAQNKAVLGFVCVFGCLLDSTNAQWGPLVDNLHVHPEARGQGIGKSLMQQAAAWVVNSYDYQRMHLFVFTANEAACKFYEKLGGTKSEATQKAMPDGELIPSLRYVWKAFDALLPMKNKA